MNLLRLTAATVAFSLLHAPLATAQSGEHHSASTVHFDKGERHHISVFAGGTDITGESETAFTLGVDYEYRVNRILGLGFIAERAFGEIDSTTLFAVADIHLWRGLVTQLGTGVEISHGNTYFAARLGALYEFEVGEGFTLAPQLHYDFSEEDSLVFGISIGRAF